MDVDGDDVQVTKSEVQGSVPKRIKELRFGVLSSQDIVNESVLEVTDRNIYDAGDGGANRQLTRHGVLDRRMGISSATAICDTCKGTLKECNGHFGYVKLALPAFHVGFMKKIIEILHDICKDCSRILLEETERRRFLLRLRNPRTDSMARDQICRKVTAECRKRRHCPHCGAVNGSVKKVPGHALKIVHEKYRWYNQSTAKSKVTPPSKIIFDNSFEMAKTAIPELEKHVRKALDDLNPLRVLNLFRKIPNADCELLGMRAMEVRPEMLIWQYVPAPPVSIRPSVAQDSASTEDDVTNKLGDIVQISSIIRAGLEKGQPVQTIMEQWDYLQIQVAMFINSEQPGLQQPGFGKLVRGFCQRLKGKQGRFRGNLSGKRVDFSARTVISPDPNLSIDEVAVPERVAMNLTYPERVTPHSIEKLRTCVRNGKSKHPGANYVIKMGGRKIVLEILARYNKLDSCAEDLQVGDVVERHLEDGDIVLFNRQPSLHKLSILSHRVKVRKWRTFRLNECVCTPYNADFDGDEMNLHVPQTEEARTEAHELMNVRHNLATPKDGTPIIAATQDFVTAAYLLSNKDRFFDRKSFAQICSYMFDANGIREPIKKENRDAARDEFAFLDIELPPPTIWKPQRLWTGKQIFNLLMRPNTRSSVLVNFEAACKEFRAVHGQAPDLNADDAWLCVQNSEIMCGVMDKNTLGAGKKDSIFYVIMRDFGPDCAVEAMNRLAKLSARWLSNEGFSIGINDVYPGAKLMREKQTLIEEAYARCNRIIDDFNKGSLVRDAGCDQEQTMENKISGILSEVRQRAGEICFQELSNWNAPVIMAKCGSKGSNINVSQMVAAVGQQIIGGARVADGFHDRTLPHFPKAARNPDSKGFVYNSFFSGLTPTEFIFHAMSGREGLVDTAVKTAETGYMSRRLMKSLEDLSTQYDDTVRNSSKGVVQFQFGDDRLDPVDMEGKSKPVNFQRTWTHARASTWNPADPSLSPAEALKLTEEVLKRRREQFNRVILTGEELEYQDTSDHGIDQNESNREFLQAISEFIDGRVQALQKAQAYFQPRQPKTATKRGRRKSAAEVKENTLANEVAKISREALEKFLTLCLSKYEKSKTQPGHAVGAVGAQSIGEPGTQMTLKTFHFAGVAGMSITQGVPRIKEIINASRNISTPVITCELNNKVNETAARLVKSRIEKTYFRDVIEHIEDVWWAEDAYIFLKVDLDRISELSLDITMADITRALIKTRGLRLDSSSVRPVGRSHMRIYLRDVMQDPTKVRAKSITKDQQEEYFIRMQTLTRILPNIVIKGYPDASRAVITKSGQVSADGTEENRLLVEGYGLKACMTTPGVDGYATRTNSVMETLSVLGIEAARATIISELHAVMGAQMDIDPRHLQLLADVMTYKGDVLGITRFGLAKMRDSVLQLASFEKTPDHLFDAAIKGKKDSISGVSECIIMGQSMRVGTGAMSVVRPLGLDLVTAETIRDGEDTVMEDPRSPSGLFSSGRGETLFEDAIAKYAATPGPVSAAA